MNGFVADLPTWKTLATFWSGPVVSANLIVIYSIVGALLLGLVLGYERSYRGRAAGMRTYGLVCMASAALTVIAGYPGEWFGGHVFVSMGTDPTRIIQGIVTGVGFLGAGVIMKEGMNISGLSTAASIWAASVIGVLIGVGFYLSAILLALLSTLCMMWIPRLSNWLPSGQAIAVVLRFREGVLPTEARLRAAARQLGYEMADSSLAISVQNGKAEWQFVVIGFKKTRHEPASSLSEELSKIEGVESYYLSYARN